eukprot:CAMPEP_0172170434 /NCGR_PEP_ID=MMETSP1050-20130122/11261_1 /TAXON_ID=233186 /ORGANISM="Cryptomonas curvata, Strain CCAP979/52" /LENGTH=227 /DNA_ID=CAMNT_0012841607 /DNA_START=101 /DNA_END=781 /DNA_ORIENTATION=+
MSDSLVAGWLTELNLMECIKTFRDEGIDSEALTGLDDAQLKELGVNRMGDRTKLRAKAMGVSLTAPLLKGAVGPEARDIVPEHLKVLQRMASPPPAARRPASQRQTIDDLASKIAATNFVLEGGPMEKYTQGGRGKVHRKFFKMLPDKRLCYESSSIGPLREVADGCGDVVREHHGDVPDHIAARSFRVITETGLQVPLIAPSVRDKEMWMEGIEILITGGYKRKTS